MQNLNKGVKRLKEAIKALEKHNAYKPTKKEQEERIRLESGASVRI